MTPAIINMVQLHFDNSIPTFGSSKLSGNNIQHGLLTRSVAAEGPTDETSNGEGAGAPIQEHRSNRQRRPSQSQKGRIRRRLSAQERLETDAVRKAGACKVCRRSKTKCRHTIRHFGRASDTTVTSIFTPSHHSPAVGLYQPFVQVSNTSATGSARIERPIMPLSQSVDLEPMLPGHISMTASLAPYMNEPVTVGLIPAFEDRLATSSWGLHQNVIPDTVHKTDHHSPLNSPTDRYIHPLPADEHWPIHSAFDRSEDMFAMEIINTPPVAEHWMQSPIAWPAKAEPYFGHNQPLAHAQVSYTGSQSYFNLDHTFPPEGSFSLADSVASTTQWNGYAIQHAWDKFEKDK